MPKYFTQPGEVVTGGLDSNDNPHHNVVDRESKSQVQVSWDHHSIHRGLHFFYTDKFTISDGATKEYLLTTPTHVAGPSLADSIHLHFIADGSAITQFDMYEDPTHTGETTDLQTSFNSHRGSTNTAGMTIHSPVTSSSDTADGTLIYTFKGGSASQQSRAGDTGQTNEEIVLKKNAKYLIRFTSGTDSNLCDLRLNWYELPPSS